MMSGRGAEAPGSVAISPPILSLHDLQQQTPINGQTGTIGLFERRYTETFSAIP
jgi:hypothetical protein